MAKGWISIHRKIEDCQIWLGNEPYDRRSAWISILLMANHEDKDILFDGQMVTVKRGQFITSVRHLGQKWMWSKDRTLRYLRLLETLQMIHRESDNRRTLITIIKYENYQNMCDSNEDTHKDSNKDTDKDTDTPQTIMKNNENKLNNNKGRFTPPSVDEVRAYCSERKNNIDPQTFIDFYESKGWFVGKNKMKDWKAAVRTWEKRNNTPKQTQFHHSEENTYDYADLEKKLLGGGV